MSFSLFVLLVARKLVCEREHHWCPRRLLLQQYTDDGLFGDLERGMTTVCDRRWLSKQCLHSMETQNCPQCHDKSSVLKSYRTPKDLPPLVPTQALPEGPKLLRGNQYGTTNGMEPGADHSWLKGFQLWMEGCEKPGISVEPQRGLQKCVLR